MSLEPTKWTAATVEPTDAGLVTLRIEFGGRGVDLVLTPKEASSLAWRLKRVADRARGRALLASLGAEPVNATDNEGDNAPDNGVSIPSR